MPPRSLVPPMSSRPASAPRQGMPPRPGNTTMIPPGNNKFSLSKLCELFIQLMDKQPDHTSPYKKTKTQNLTHPEVNYLISKGVKSPPL